MKPYTKYLDDASDGIKVVGSSDKDRVEIRICLGKTLQFTVGKRKFLPSKLKITGDDALNREYRQFVSKMRFTHCPDCLKEACDNIGVWEVFSRVFCPDDCDVVKNGSNQEELEKIAKEFRQAFPDFKAFRKFYDNERKFIKLITHEINSKPLAVFAVGGETMNDQRWLNTDQPKQLVKIPGVVTDGDAVRKQAKKEAMGLRALKKDSARSGNSNPSPLNKRKGFVRAGVGVKPRKYFIRFEGEEGTCIQKPIKFACDYLQKLEQNEKHKIGELFYMKDGKEIFIDRGKIIFQLLFSKTLISLDTGNRTKNTHWFLHRESGAAPDYLGKVPDEDIGDLAANRVNEFKEGASLYRYISSKKSYESVGKFLWDGSKVISEVIISPKQKTKRRNTTNIDMGASALNQAGKINEHLVYGWRYLSDDINNKFNTDIPDEASAKAAAQEIADTNSKEVELYSFKVTKRGNWQDEVLIDIFFPKSLSDENEFQASVTGRELSKENASTDTRQLEVEEGIEGNSLEIKKDSAVTELKADDNGDNGSIRKDEQSENNLGSGESQYLPAVQHFIEMADGEYLVAMLNIAVHRLTSDVPEAQDWRKWKDGVPGDDGFAGYLVVEISPDSCKPIGPISLQNFKDVNEMNEQIGQVCIYKFFPLSADQALNVARGQRSRAFKSAQEILVN